MSELMIAANGGASASAPAAAPASAAPAAPAAPAVAPAAPAKNVPAAPAKAAPGKPGTVQKPKEAPQSQPSPWMSMLPFILIFVVMIFFMNRSQKKAMAKRQEMMDRIAKGTKVLLTSGIYGTVDAVQDDAMIVEIANGVKIKVAKAGISNIVSPADGKSESGKSEAK